MSDSKTTSSPVLALDIGNTRAHIGIVDTMRGICIGSTAFPTGDIEHHLVTEVSTLIGTNADVPPGRIVAIASVVSAAAATATTLLQREGFSVRQLSPASPLPFAIRYDTPHSLGADRIANALYAATFYPGKDVVIVSAGTAIVVDFCSGGTFRGGAILPGIRLQLESLHLGTAALPVLSGATPTTIPLLPGSSTDHCMLGGVVRGAAAAIRAIVAGYGNREQPPVVCATGGDWQVLAPLVNFDHVTIPGLTLIGTACFLNDT